MCTEYTTEKDGAEQGGKKKYITRLKWTHAKLKPENEKNLETLEIKLQNIGQIVLVQ